MKVQIPKISDEDFDGLLPSPNLPPQQPIKTKSAAAPVVTPLLEQLPAEKADKASKPSKSKTASDQAISVRLAFSTKDFKSLTLLALSESEKIGKRVSVTSLLADAANKLIKKGNANG